MKRSYFLTMLITVLFMLPVILVCQIPCPIVNVGIDKTLCNCESINLDEAWASEYSGLSWTTSGDGTFNAVNIQNPTYTPGANDCESGVVELCLTAYPNPPCSIPFTDCMVLIILQGPLASAGDDMTICEGQSITLQGIAENFTELLWYTPNGTGTFSDNTVLTPVYTPSASDYSMGSVDICLVAHGIDPCEDAEDCMTLTFAQSLDVYPGSNATVCCDPYSIIDAYAGNYSMLIWTTNGDGYFDNAMTLNPTYYPGSGDCSNGNVDLCLTASPQPPCTTPVTECITLTLSVYDPLINIDASIEHVICYGINDGSIAISVSGGTPPYNYFWDDGATTPYQDSLSEGTYCVTVIDAAGHCSNICATVNEPSQIIIIDSIVPVSYPEGNDGQLILNVSGGISPYLYSIDNGVNFQESNIFTNLEENVYLVVVMDNSGCKGIREISLVSLDPEYLNSPEIPLVYVSEELMNAISDWTLLPDSPAINIEDYLYDSTSIDEIEITEFMTAYLDGVFWPINGCWCRPVITRTIGKSPDYKAYSKDNGTERDFYEGYDGAVMNKRLFYHVKPVLSHQNHPNNREYEIGSKNNWTNRTYAIINYVCVNNELMRNMNCCQQSLDLMVQYDQRTIAGVDGWGFKVSGQGMNAKAEGSAVLFATDDFTPPVVTPLASCHDLTWRYHKSSINPNFLVNLVNFAKECVKVVVAKKLDDTAITGIANQLNNMILTPIMNGAGEKGTSTTDTKIDYQNVLTLYPNTKKTISLFSTSNLKVRGWRNGGHITADASISTSLSMAFVVKRNTLPNCCYKGSANWYVSTFGGTLQSEGSLKNQIGYFLHNYHDPSLGGPWLNTTPPRIPPFTEQLPSDGYKMIINSHQGSAIGSYVCRRHHVWYIPGGWSGISSYIVPDDPAIVNVLSGIEDEMKLILRQTPFGLYWPGENINTMLNWDSYKGYKIKMNQAAEFEMNGELVDPPIVTLPAGSHFLPVLSPEGAGLEMLTALGNDLMFAYNIHNQLVYWPAGGLYSLESLEPGVAYLIRLNDQATFNFSGKSAPKTKPVAAFVNTSPWNDVLKTGDAHIISISGSAMADLADRDVIGVFNHSGLCVGMNGIETRSENAALIAYGDDFTTSSTDGLVTGENMIFRLYRPSTCQSANLDVTFDAKLNTGTFEPEAVSMITGLKVGSLGVSEVSKTVFDIYPNPSNGLFNVVTNGKLTIQVMNVQGQIVNTSLIEGNNTLDLSGQSNGIYFIKVETEHNVFIKKLVIN